jgi:hypothetical protein
MNPRIRVLLAAGCIAAYSTVPVLLRPLYPLISNAGTCAQRMESLAHAVVRVQSFTHTSGERHEVRP